MKKTFLHQRQAPQEIIEPNEVEEPEASQDDEEEEKGDFKEVKLCSKHGAYLIDKKDGTYIYFAT